MGSDDRMDVAAVLHALGGVPGEPAVLLRLLLVAADEATGEPRVVSRFVKKLPMLPSVVGPGVDVAIDILGERRVFTPTDVVWDEVHRVCILEVAWVVDDGPNGCAFETAAAPLPS